MADEQLDVSPREKLRLARLAAVHKLGFGRVRVTPRDDVARATIRHPSGLGFMDTGDMEWPDDRFTRRRIADGTITVSKPADEQPVGQAQSSRASSARGAAAATSDSTE